MTPHSCRQPRRNPQAVKSFAFYVGSLKGLSATQKLILWYVTDCFERGPPFQPSLVALGKLCSCSRRTVMKDVIELDEQEWIEKDWRGGQKTNIYLPGWRLKKILLRYRKGKA